ncbi:MAG: ABC transporter [Candidatus Dadabacteria bacterium]|nr:MAG: ABC transporter [Candidatus Dadabacteria bacterium]
MSEEFSKYRPFFTLCKKEVLRFFSVSLQTVLAPIITSSLYLLVFGVSLGKRIILDTDFTYAQYVIPGLIIMGVASNSFSNSSASLFMARYLGYVVDILVAPITPIQIILAYTIASMLRGLLVGGMILVISTFFADLPWHAPLYALFLAIAISFLFSQFGLIAGAVSSSFDTLSMFTNFLILPLIYLGGLFYPISQLPPFWRGISALNPLYYMIEGFRAAALGKGDVTIALAFWISGAISAGLLFFVAGIIKRGIKIKV